MSYARVLCVGLVGVAGHLVEVEADLSAGLPAVVLTGLPDTALHEARDRVRAAVVNSGRPGRTAGSRSTCCPRPAQTRQRLRSRDRRRAAGRRGELPAGRCEAWSCSASSASTAPCGRSAGCCRWWPRRPGRRRPGDRAAGNAGEATVVPGVTVRPSTRCAGWWRSSAARTAARPAAGRRTATAGPIWPTSPVRRWAARLEVAAAGGHHLALFGPPGAGKTMLAERLPSILPELDDDAALEVTALQSIAGVLPPDGSLVRRPPFQAPHHSASLAA
jgi:magnesium chelatase family protein